MEPRNRSRTVLPASLCLVGAFVVSNGDCSVAPPAPLSLQPRYVLVLVHRSPPPVQFFAGGGLTRSILADTLTFTGGTYTESGTVRVDSAGTTRIIPTLIGPLPFSRLAEDRLLLPQTIAANNAVFTFNFVGIFLHDPPAVYWYFEPR